MIFADGVADHPVRKSEKIASFLAGSDYNLEHPNPVWTIARRGKLLYFNEPPLRFNVSVVLRPRL